MARIFATYLQTHVKAGGESFGLIESYVQETFPLFKFRLGGVLGTVRFEELCYENARLGQLPFELLGDKTPRELLSILEATLAPQRKS